jgi:hypothetical protein
MRQAVRLSYNVSDRGAVLPRSANPTNDRKMFAFNYEYSSNSR